MNNQLYALFLESGFKFPPSLFTDTLKKTGQVYEGKGYWLLASEKKPDQIASSIRSVVGENSVEIFPIATNVIESGIVNTATRQFLSQYLRAAA